MKIEGGAGPALVASVPAAGKEGCVMVTLFDDDRPPAALTAALLRRGAAMEIRARVWRDLAGLKHMRPALYELAPDLLAEADRVIGEEQDDHQ